MRRRDVGRVPCPCGEEESFEIVKVLCDFADDKLSQSR